MSRTGTSVSPAVPAAGRAPEADPAGRRGGRLVREARTVRLMWRRETIRFARNRLRVAMGLLTPLMFLLILGTGLQSAADGFDQYRAFLFPGVLLMALQAPAIAVGASIVWDRQSGFLRQVLAAPLSRGSILVGICLGGATSGTLYAACVLVTAPVVGVPYGPGLLLVLLELALIAFAFTAFGVVAAVTISRPETFQIVIGLAMMPLLFLSGAMFPAGGLPGWLGAAVLLNPLTYGVDAVRRAMPGDGVVTYGDRVTGPEPFGWAPPVLLEVGLIALLGLAAVTVAARHFARSR
ncbi:ABC transporter permease [Streptomyces ziwulingensis]|uniref:Transport permease protein n=1 Tax=Streptomyces ziwulingensis TaxID=1045501 RepID=A0ABP9BTI2_9ACTN